MRLDFVYSFPPLFLSYDFSVCIDRSPNFLTRHAWLLFDYIVLYDLKRAASSSKLDYRRLVSTSYRLPLSGTRLNTAGLHLTSL